MIVPGSNLLGIALTAISPTGGATYKQFLSETENDMGTTVKVYAEPVTLFGCSIQPVPYTIVSQLGLDVSKQYVGIWTQKDVQGVYEGRQGDLVNWNGADWEVTAEESWMQQDGWKQITAVRQ